MAPNAWSAIQSRTMRPGPAITAAGTIQVSRPVSTPSVPRPIPVSGACRRTCRGAPSGPPDDGSDGSLPDPEAVPPAPDSTATGEAVPDGSWLRDSLGDDESVGSPLGVGLGEPGRPIEGSGTVGQGTGVGDGVGSGSVGSDGVGVGSGIVGKGRLGSGRLGVGSGRLGVGSGTGVGVGVGVGATVGTAVGTGVGVTAGPVTMTTGGTPRRAPVPLQSCCRNARAVHAKDPTLSAVAPMVKVTQSSVSSRSPPLVARTMTRFPASVAIHELPVLDPVTVALATLKFDGTSTRTQPISLLLSTDASGSSFVALNEKVVATPVVTARGDAVSVQRADSAEV